MFCIIFAIIGIPFTLSVIADVGSICATVVSTIYEKYKPWYQKIRKRYREYKKNRRKKKGLNWIDYRSFWIFAWKANIFVLILNFQYCSRDRIWRSIGWWCRRKQFKRRWWWVRRRWWWPRRYSWTISIRDNSII